MPPFQGFPLVTATLSYRSRAGLGCVVPDGTLVSKKNGGPGLRRMHGMSLAATAWNWALRAEREYWAISEIGGRVCGSWLRCQTTDLWEIGWMK